MRDLVRARGWVRQSTINVALAMGAVSLATLGVDPRVTARWGLSMTHVDWPVFLRLAPLPALAGVLCFLLWRGGARHDATPYLLGVGLFLLGYVGLAISLFPYIVPFAKSLVSAL